MSENAPPEPAAPRKPDRRWLLAIPLLLLVAVAVNWKDIRAIAAGRKTVMSVLYGRSMSLQKPTWSFPGPAGPADAKVKVHVSAQEGNPCHIGAVSLWLGVSDLEPKRVRVEFSGSGPAPGTQPAAKPEAKPEEMDCASVTINGQRKFELGEGKARRVIYLSGPHPTPVGQPQGVQGPHGQGWSLDDVAALVNRALKEQYGQEGTLSGRALASASTAALKRVPPAKLPPRGTPPHSAPAPTGGPVRPS